MNQPNVGPAAMAKYKQQPAFFIPNMQLTALSTRNRAVPEDIHVPTSSMHIIVFDTPYRMN